MFTRALLIPCLISTLWALSSAQAGWFDGGVLAASDRTLRVSGAVIYEDGTPVQPQEIHFQLNLSGFSDLVKGLKECAPHKTVERKLMVGFGGQYQFDIPLREFFVTDAAQECHGSARGSSEEAVRVDIAVAGTFKNCLPYCKAHSPQTESSCLASCSGREKLLLATKSMPRSVLGSAESSTREVLEMDSVNLVLGVKRNARP